LAIELVKEEQVFIHHYFVLYGLVIYLVYFNKLDPYIQAFIDLPMLTAAAVLVVVSGLACAISLSFSTKSKSNLM
jgi:hypothetical protein